MRSVAEYTLTRTGLLRVKRKRGHGVRERPVSVNQQRLLWQQKKKTAEAEQIPAEVI